MGKPIVLAGAHIKVYVNNILYKPVQAISLVVDYGVNENYGIDSNYPQELSPGKVSVRGSVKGIRTKYSGGLQAFNLRPLFQDIAASPYVSIRIQDRSTGEDIVFIPNAMVTMEDHGAAIKGTYKLNWNFTGQIPLFALDRS